MATYLDVLKRGKSLPAVSSTWSTGPELPFKPSQPTAKFLEMYRTMRNPPLVKTARKFIGVPKLFLFQGVLDGCYTSGNAVAIACSKEDAIEVILESVKEKERIDNFHRDFWEEMESSYNIKRPCTGGDIEKYTGLSMNTWGKMLPHSQSSFGTWSSVHKPNLVEQVKKELEACDPDVIPFDRPFGWFCGGGD